MARPPAREYTVISTYRPRARRIFCLSGDPCGLDAWL